MGVEAKCYDCGMEAKAHVHVYMSVDDLDGMKEMWIHGDIDLLFTADLWAEAKASLEWSSLNHVVPQRLCIPPLCYGLEWAGIGVKVGVVVDMSLKAELSVTGIVTLQMQRAAKAPGQIVLHKTPNGAINSHTSGFNFEPLPGMSNPPEIQAEIEATLGVSVIAALYAGLISDVDFAFDFVQLSMDWDNRTAL